MTTLMPIGVFAHATRLSVRALRNYDRLGLLVPALIDPGTGYRRYSLEQFARAGLIRRLRELEVPLAEIAEILDAGTPDDVKAAIKRHHDRVVTRAAELAAIGGELDSVLAEPTRWLHVYERTRAPQPIARLTIQTALGGLAELIGPAYGRLFAALEAQGVAPAGPPGTRYLTDDPDELTVELFVPVSEPVRADGDVDSAELPGCLLAATIHEGDYDDVETAYRSLGRWIAERDRVPAGPAEELYLVAPGPSVTPEAYRTEIAWPVRP
ncbi:MerR family transcriptional regulator [Amycolatopsis regifaucium]|uniref:Transcriptional regulator n=1 Tax=Amycolatopsis regifaucium TaxID=546365 RepID=A0A154MJZ2_9PSEU|nr:GyrI-like domain-containing protein [Amycolatopsis regifaucium]KZB84227.1 transcriptional regulator [Amycolatopsis regifaucium]OKA03676.1 MerR family transcriptional regulator [Amycolatopsis regifaucium]SFJ21927.1 DNA-binding transcriptional regulator, MerR family [Amycolatopsis regifaucium]